MKTYTSILLLLLMCNSLHSQSILLERGENGYSAAAGFFINSESPGILLSGSFSYKGVIDVGLQWQKGKRGTPYKSFVIPRLVYFLLKEGDTPNAPTVGIGLQYQRLTGNENTIVQVPLQPAGYTTMVINKDVTYHYVIFSGCIHRTLTEWQLYAIRPFGECGFGVSNQGWKFIWKLGATLSKPLKGDNIFYILPYIQREPYTTTFIISTGIIFQ